MDPRDPSANPTLRHWLGSAEHAGLKGKKLQVALRIVDDELIETVQELQELRTKGRLAEVFKQQGLRLAVENAMDKKEGNVEKTRYSGGGEDGSASDILPALSLIPTKSKRRLSQVGMQMLKDAEKSRGKRPDLDEELVTHRSRSTSGAVIKKSRARKNERRSSIEEAEENVVAAAVASASAAYRRNEVSLPRCASTDSIDATDLVLLDESELDLHLAECEASSSSKPVSPLVSHNSKSSSFYENMNKEHPYANETTATKYMGTAFDLFKITSSMFDFKLQR
jgi:hypothetical protein